MLKKTLVAATIALTMAGAGFALAQNAQPGPSRGARDFRPNAEDVAAFTDARIAGLKAGLKLTAEQEKNWPAFETALRDRSKQRADRMKERSERMNARGEARRNGSNDAAASTNRPDTIARLREGADAMTAQAANLKKFADAAEPLYKSLDDGQKRRFSMLLRMGARAGHGGFHHHHGQRRADNAR